MFREMESIMEVSVITFTVLLCIAVKAIMVFTLWCCSL